MLHTSIVLPITSQQLKRRLIVITLSYALVAMLITTVFLIIGLQYLAVLRGQQFVLFLAFVAVPTFGLLLILDYLGIQRHLRPILPAFQHIENGNNDSHAMKQAVTQLLNLPYLTFKRIIFWHTVPGVLMALIYTPVIIYLFNLDFETWQVLGAALAVFFAGFTHATLEYYAVLRFVRNIIPSFSALLSDYDAQQGIIPIGIQRRMLFVGIWISVMPLFVMIFSLGVRISELDPTDEQIFLIVSWVISVLLVVLGIAIWIARYISTDIETLVSKLRQAMQRVEQGELDTNLPILSSDEFIDLYLGFNRMTDGLVERERLHDAFGRYVSPELAEQIRKDGIQMTGQTIDATVMFCDIRNYTRMSSNMQPTEVVNLLNHYFAMVEPIVKAEGGWINKFLGDGFMAVFGAPVPRKDHVDCAVRASVQIRETTHHFNEKFPDIPNVSVGIGLECGDMVAGSIGSPDRIEFTVIGDAVNVASRIESLNKELSTTILVSENIKSAVGDNYEWRTMPPTHVKGKSEPIQIYTLD